MSSLLSSYRLHVLALDGIEKLRGDESRLSLHDRRVSIRLSSSVIRYPTMTTLWTASTRQKDHSLLVGSMIVFELYHTHHQTP